MNWAALDIHGIVVMHGTSPHIDENTTFPPADRIIIGSPDGLIPDRHFIDGNHFKLIPEKPGDAYLLDRQTKQWIVDVALAESQARAQRDRLLAETDWTQSRDVPESTVTKWQPYRQALRDIPQQPGFPQNIIWPIKPT